MAELNDETWYQISRDAHAAGMFEDDRAEIASNLAGGRYAVVAEVPVYCRMTDAVLGSNRHLIAVFDTEEEARSWEECPEMEFVVSPPVHSCAPPPATHPDDIPF